MHSVQPVSLANGVKMPQLGYGVYKVPPDRTAELVTLALESGYRSVDTATMYGNEAGVGSAVGAAIAAGADRVGREDLFVTTKIVNDAHGFDSTIEAYEQSLAELQLDYVDLLLIHWPCPAKGLYVETYQAMETLYHEGRVRSIGVSNFEPEHLERLMDQTEVVPAVNQVELHPYLQQQQLRDFHAAHGIATEAWSPLGRGAALQDPALLQLAAKHHVSISQVIVRWHLQLGHIAIPKASSGERIRQNIAVFNFELDEQDMATISRLDSGRRMGSHPAEVN
ncbi:aldo/keto reductase [Arthrobacter castelli]|uniref:aldo/keto reductase n=1 Tax=Arthrobacter castelli TaxID=271431 RepID=UPI00047DC070|nr:aldo/keto reductase [Arthrobacter castelli]